MSDTAQMAVIIVTWRSRPAIEARLAVLERLAGVHGTQIIFVDNASDDGLVDFLRLNAPWATILANRGNEGFARACNRGANVAGAPLLLFLNPDARIEPEDVAVLRGVMESDPRAGLAGPALVDESGRIYPSAHRDPDAITYWATHSLISPLWRRLRGWFAGRAGPARPVDWLMGACLLARREAFEEAGGFSEDYFLYSEDAELALRMRQAQWKVLHVPRAVCIHQQGQSARQNALQTRVALFHSLRLYGRRCRGPEWLAAMRRSVRLDMALRRAAIAVIRVARPSFDRDASRRKAIQRIQQEWLGQ